MEEHVWTAELREALITDGGDDGVAAFNKGEVNAGY